MGPFSRDLLITLLISKKEERLIPKKRNTLPEIVKLIWVVSHIGKRKYVQARIPNREYWWSENVQVTIQFLLQLIKRYKYIFYESSSQIVHRFTISWPTLWYAALTEFWIFRDIIHLLSNAINQSCNYLICRHKYGPFNGPIRINP